MVTATQLSCPFAEEQTIANGASRLDENKSALCAFCSIPCTNCFFAQSTVISQEIMLQSRQTNRDIEMKLLKEVLSVKATIITIALVLIVLLLTSCGRNENNEGYIPEYPAENDIPPPPPPPQIPDETDTPHDPPPPVTHTTPRYIPTYGVFHQPEDLGGRTIRVATFWPNNTPLFGFLDEPDPAATIAYPNIRRMWNNAERVRHSFNIEFEEVPFFRAGQSVTMADMEAAMEQLLTSTAAGAPIADVVLLFDTNKIHTILADILVPLDSINLPNSDILGSQLFAVTVAELFGERWSFSSATPNTEAVMLGVNLDIINSIGAPNPVDLYHQGEWN